MVILVIERNNGLLVKRWRRHPLTVQSGVRFPYGSPYAIIAQLVERRLAKAKVASSSLVYRSIKVLTLFIKSDKIKHVMRALHSGSASAFQADSAGSIPAARSTTSFYWKIQRKKILEKNFKKRCWQARKYLVKYKTCCERNTK